MSVVLLVTFVTSVTPATAQTYAFGSDFFFYGDNTEFTNPFRSGETTLGVSGRVFVDIVFNDTATLRGGLFGLGRFGAHEFLEHAEPAIALQLTRGASRFLFGTIETVATRPVAGPDEETPHQLLPPIQQETLAFTRGQEMGLQWLVAAPRLEHDAWINWHRLNTAAHREQFDAGYRASLRVWRAVQLRGQWHVVHDGGQQFQSGPVSDSQAAALGLQWSSAATPARISLDVHAIATRDVPDRHDRTRSEGGIGVFARGALVQGDWRTHLIVWRSRDTLKTEGDANYLARRRNGTMFRKVRDYAEFGITRHFHPAPEVQVFAAFRLHRVESNYEYSYRIAARVRLRHTF
jgi:hypothetical protein